MFYTIHHSPPGEVIRWCSYHEGSLRVVFRSGVLFVSGYPEFGVDGIGWEQWGDGCGFEPERRLINGMLREFLYIPNEKWVAEDNIRRYRPKIVSPAVMPNCESRHAVGEFCMRIPRRVRAVLSLFPDFHLELASLFARHPVLLDAAAENRGYAIVLALYAKLHPQWETPPADLSSRKPANILWCLGFQNEDAVLTVLAKLHGSAIQCEGCLQELCEISRNQALIEMLADLPVVCPLHIDICGVKGIEQILTPSLLHSYFDLPRFVTQPFDINGTYFDDFLEVARHYRSRMPINPVHSFEEFTVAQRRLYDHWCCVEPIALPRVRLPDNPLLTLLTDTRAVIEEGRRLDHRGLKHWLSSALNMGTLAIYSSIGPAATLLVYVDKPESPSNLFIEVLDTHWCGLKPSDLNHLVEPWRHLDIAWASPE